MTTPESQSRHSCVATRYGLDMAHVSQYEKRMFKKMMDDAKKKGAKREP